MIQKTDHFKQKTTTYQDFFIKEFVYFIEKFIIPHVLQCNWAAKVFFSCYLHRPDYFTAALHTEH